MAAPLTAPMPQTTRLGYNTTVVVEALDPVTGAPVAGVTVSGVELWADVSLGADDSTPGYAFAPGPFMLTAGPNA